MGPNASVDLTSNLDPGSSQRCVCGQPSSFAYNQRVGRDCSLPPGCPSPRAGAPARADEAAGVVPGARVPGLKGQPWQGGGVSLCQQRAVAELRVSIDKMRAEAMTRCLLYF